MRQPRTAKLDPGPQMEKKSTHGFRMTTPSFSKCKDTRKAMVDEGYL